MAMPPVEYAIFAATLVGIAFLHRHALAVALTGLGALLLLRLGASPDGASTLASHFAYEWPLLVNLLLLLTGFALLSRHFELSGAPQALLARLPAGRAGAFALLAIVFVLSAFLDNIAAAIIGATLASVAFARRVHIGYLAAIVACANAGGAGSVIGDTTTTMMWIAGIPALTLMQAFLAALVAFVVIAVPASAQQHQLAPAILSAEKGRVDHARLAVVVAILACALAANIGTHAIAPAWGERLPVLGLAVWIAILVLAPFARPDWPVLPEAARGSLFLVALVAAASLMPVEQLPAAAWQTAFGLGWLSAVFDNIPLTALALRQGGYDWALLGFAVGFGGSMVWFGSSAGVAVANLYPEARSVGRWLKAGWHVPLGYIAGYFTQLVLLGWNPR